MSKKHKIRTVGGDALAANPFTTLDGSGLSKGEMKPPVTLPEQKSVKEKSKGRVEVRRENSDHAKRFPFTYSLEHSGGNNL